VRTSGQPLAWLPAAEANAQRGDFFRQPWRIGTEHFAITTNVPLDEAIRFGRRLEAVHEAFLVLLADAIEPAQLPLAQRFRDPRRQATPATKPFQVWYLADRQAYVKYARDTFGRDERVSLGYYLDPRESRRFRKDARSYFYRDPDQDISAQATLFHEASHQVLFETGGPTAYDRNLGQYWVWEGLGTAFETFTPTPDGAYTFGTLSGPRVAKAHQDLEAGRWLPFDEFLALGPARFRDDSRVYTHYAQAMVLALYLLQGEGGRHREAFAAYVRDAYQGRFRGGLSTPDLASRLGLAADELDARVAGYLRQGFRPEPPTTEAPGRAGNLPAAPPVR
jgi:hypothetical protein